MRPCICIFVLLLTLAAGCSEQADQNSSATPESSSSAPAHGMETAENEKSNSPSSATQDIFYQELFKKIISSQASLAEVRQAMTDPNPASLSNTVHALYNLHWHRGVHNVLEAMWKLDKTTYPEFSWHLIEKPPVRIAVASTLNRTQIGRTGGSREYIEYIRQLKNEKHEFNLAQIAVALGLNGDPADVDYVKSLASGDNHYVIQSSLTALALMHNTTARDALMELGTQFKNDSRSKLIAELLQQAYNVDATEVVTQ